MKKLTLFLLLVFCAGYSLWGQEIDEDLMLNNDVPGYVILASGDTVMGKIRVDTRSKNQVRVKFTPKDSFKSVTYKAKDKELVGYCYTTRENNGSLQRVDKERSYSLKEADQPPVPFSSNIVFMEVKAIGKANLYSYYVESNTQVENTYLHYYFIESKYSENADEKRERKVAREDFERIIESFTEDCPGIRNLIGSRYDYSNLDRIVIQYNDCEKQIVDGGCGECAVEAERKRQEAERLKKEREEQEQFKSSNNKGTKN